MANLLLIINTQFEDTKENKQKFNDSIKALTEIDKDIHVGVDWDFYRKELDNLFGASSFEYLKKMDYYPEADEEGNYDTSLEEIHADWDYQNCECKSNILKDVGGLSDLELLNIILKENWGYFQ